MTPATVRPPSAEGKLGGGRTQSRRHRSRPQHHRGCPDLYPTSHPEAASIRYAATMDAKEARRAAEKAAREAMTAKVAVVGDLGAVHTDYTGAADQIEAARAKGRELIAAAEARAAELVDAATEAQRTLGDRYATAHRSAVDVGWSSAELARMGFPAPTGARRRGSRSEQTNQTDESTVTAA